MRCLVTGVAGFIGSHLAERLLLDGHEVYGVDAFTDYYARTLKDQHIRGLYAAKRFSLIEGDLLSLDLVSLLEGIDWVFHLAAQAGVRASWGKDFARYTDCNILATQQLLEATMRAERVQRFVYSSSSAVYGDTMTLPVAESLAPHPVSPYGVTKLAAEHLCKLYYHNFGVPIVSLRYFTVYGPRQRPDMAFYRFCKALCDDKPLQVYGDGSQTRDFTYVSDIVEANMLAAITPQSVGEVLNIAGGSRVTVRQVLELLADFSTTPLEVIYGDQQHGDVHDTFADITRARQVLGYRPEVTLREGLAQELAYVFEMEGEAMSQASR